MGLLDDAIRDHLELKRRRGADPAEVERAEREALGPVRRQPEEADDLDFGDEPMAGSEPDVSRSEELLYDDSLPYDDESEPDAGWSDPVLAPPADEPRMPPAQDPARSPERERFDQPDRGVDTKPHEAVRPEQPGPAASFDPAPGAGAPERTPVPESPQGGADVPPRQPPRPVGEETAEYDVEGKELGRGESEDVLEETPEFLQDTPDHDRLWFEQRPPRDFNFDG